MGTKRKISLRKSFEERFGKSNALRLISAAQSHANGANSENKGTNLFRWACLVAIGYECIGRFREYHKLTFTEEAFWEWAEQHKEEWAKHKGDLDYLALFCGTYNRLMPVDKPGQTVVS